MAYPSPMRTRQMSDPSLTSEQQIKAACAVLCDGVTQQTVAFLFGVNIGRVNEAVQAARAAFGFPQKIKKEDTNEGEL
jgi:hypothetical protein